MRLTLILIIIALFGCSVKQQFTLPADKEINFNYTVYNACTTHYVLAHDTLHPILARVLSYDEKGRENEVVFKYFEGKVPAMAVTIYDSAGKKSEEYYRLDEKPSHGSASKTLYFYNDQQQLVRTVSFGFMRRVRKDVDKGFGRPDGCIITEDDYEKYKSWRLSTIWNYIYDDNGRLIEKLSPTETSQNRYLYEYDGKGRLLEERSLDGNTLIWIERYKYGQRDYEFTRTWFKIKTSVDTFRYKTDNFNNVTQELVIEEGGRQVSRHNKYYDSNNHLVKHEIFDEHDKLLGYYVYQYSTTATPTNKNFFVDAK